MYTISEDGTLNKDGKMCYCIYTEGSCTSSCVAFEERVKDRIFLYCAGREIIAKPEARPLVVNAEKNTPSADPLGIDAEAPKTSKTKKGAKK